MQEEQMKIIEMFHGTVFIVDPVKNKILFEKETQEEDFKIISDDGCTIRDDKIYKIISNFSLNDQKLD